MPCDRPRSEARWEKVVVRAAGGEQAAIDELVAELRSRLRRYCQAHVRDEHEVPGVLEAALGDVVAALPGMRERRAPFPSWAYGLAAHRVRAANDDGDVQAAREYLQSQSPQKQGILAGVARGLTIEQIAASLYLSVGTTQTYLRQIYRSSGIRPLGGRTSATIRVVGELLRDREVAGLGGARTGEYSAEEDRAEEGDLDLRAARAALLADLRATVPGYDVLTAFEAADRQFGEPLEQTVEREPEASTPGE
jgi:DNA-binding NarL/FixJ family response regulator